MAILPIRQLGDPVLREVARPVERFDAALARLAGDMMETMYDAPGVGLAAPQIGRSLRFFVFDPSPGDDRHPGAVANPELSDAEGEQTDEEGCLSVPNVWSPTTRALTIRVTGQDLDGNPLSLLGEGLEARIFQHEVDHLNATLFIDRLGAEDRRRVMAELRDREMAGLGRWRRRR
jgi:peptide deformylase